MCVLIVDDDSARAALYADWLGDAGHGVSIVSDAECAILLAPLLRPAVTVIELGAHGVDGFDLVDQLRRVPTLKLCRYIAVTASTSPGLTKRCCAAGFAGLLNSPVLRETLVEQVLAAAFRKTSVGCKAS